MQQERRREGSQQARRRPHLRRGSRPCRRRRHDRRRRRGHTSLYKTCKQAAGNGGKAVLQGAADMNNVGKRLAHPGSPAAPAPAHGDDAWPALVPLRAAGGRSARQSWAARGAETHCAQRRADAQMFKHSRAAESGKVLAVRHCRLLPLPPAGAGARDRLTQAACSCREQRATVDVVTRNWARRRGLRSSARGAIVPTLPEGAGSHSKIGDRKCTRSSMPASLACSFGARGVSPIVLLSSQERPGPPSAV